MIWWFRDEAGTQEFRLDTETHDVQVKSGEPSDPAHLEDQEYRILTHLIDNVGSQVGRDTLLSLVPGTRAVQPAVLQVRTNRIRNKIGDRDRKCRRFIRTVSGNYVFVGHEFDPNADVAPKRLSLVQERSECANRDFANALLVASSQDAMTREADGALYPQLDISINKDESEEFHLTSVRFRTTLPRGSSVARVLGRRGPQNCGERVVIRKRGDASPWHLCWEILPQPPNFTLENCNVWTEDPCLMSVHGLHVGEVIKSQLFAAPKDFKRVDQSTGSAGPELPPEKGRIIEALKLKLHYRAEGEEILLVDLEDVVQESRA